MIAINRGELWEAFCLETGSEIRGYGQTVEQSVENLFALIKPRVMVIYPVKVNISQFSKADSKLILYCCKPVKHYIKGVIVWNLLLLCQYILRFKKIKVQLVIDFRAFRKTYSP